MRDRCRVVPRRQPSTGGVKALGIAAVLLIGPLHPVSAQVAVQVSVGARYSGTLVHDSIVTPIDARPSIAPAFAVAVALPEHRGWSGQAVLDFSWSGLKRHDAGGTSEDLGGLGALSFSVGLRRSLAAGLGARATVGGLRYLPARESGVFRAGTGGLFPLLGVGIDYTPGVGGLSLELRGDAHRFLTQALRDVGFTQHRLVPRFTLAVRTSLSSLW